MGEAPVRTFLESEVERLEAFDFVAFGPAGNPLHVVEITRREGGSLEVRVPGRPPIVPGLAEPTRALLRERGFSSEDDSDPKRPWARSASDSASAVASAFEVLTGVFGAKPDAPVDVAHGSHRAEHEARLKLERVRERVEQVLHEMLGSVPQRDGDGDYVLPLNDVHVLVAPRVIPTGDVILRVFAVTNVGVNVTPDLGLLLARLNFGLMFGRFALDAEHRSIWVDETLLGEHVSDEQLRFTIGMVASIADEWDDRLKQMFGGATYQEVLTQRSPAEAPTPKPGAGGYL